MELPIGLQKKHHNAVDHRSASRPSFDQNYDTALPIILLWELAQEMFRYVRLEFSDFDAIAGTLKQARGIKYAYGKSPTARAGTAQNTLLFIAINSKIN